MLKATAAKTLILTALAWGAWTLYREYRTRDDEL